jgi:hypothetical protein
MNLIELERALRQLRLVQEAAFVLVPLLEKLAERRQRFFLAELAVLFGVDGLLQFGQDRLNVLGLLVGSFCQLLLQAVRAVFHASFK